MNNDTVGIVIPAARTTNTIYKETTVAQVDLTAAGTVDAKISLGSPGIVGLPS